MKLLICTQAVDENNPVLGFFLSWIREFAAQCDEVTVICLTKGTYSLPSNVRVISLGKESQPSRARYIATFLRTIWRERNNYDAVFVHMNPEYVVLGGAWWRLLRKQVGLWYVHKSVTTKLKVASRFANYIFTVSEKTFPLKNNKVMVVGHGIDVDAFVPTNGGGETFHVVTIGRIAESKHTLDVIDIVVKTRERIPHILFSIYGSGTTPQERVYEARVKERVQQVGGCIELKGSIPHKDVPQALATADAFLTLGATGGIDKAVLEAMAASVPVVTYDNVHAPLVASHADLLVVEDETQAAAALTRLSGMTHAQRLIIGTDLKQVVLEQHSLNSLVKNILWTLTKNK